MCLRRKQNNKNQSILGIHQTTCTLFRGYLNFSFSDYQGNLFCKVFCGFGSWEFWSQDSFWIWSTNKKYHLCFHHRLPLSAVYLEKYCCCKSREAPLVVWKAVVCSGFLEKLHTSSHQKPARIIEPECFTCPSPWLHPPAFGRGSEALGKLGMLS